MMCVECVEAEGGPVPLTAAIREAAAAIVALEEVHVTGGFAHIVTDDYNVDDADLAFCREACRTERHEDGTDNSLELRVLDALQPMTPAERATSIGLADGYFGDVSERTN